MNRDHLQRVENERVFHDARFTDEVRDAQGKYYAAIKHGSFQFDTRIRKIAVDRDVLEYGCGEAIQGLDLAATAKSLTGIDISGVAIAGATAEATRRGLQNARYLTMNAESLTFADETFDLVFGRGIIHHLDLNRCFSSVRRVLRPGGTALFWEPLGHNPVLNRYRNKTPEARTPDEHPLLKADFALARKYFSIADLRFFGLTTLASVPIRDTKLGDKLLWITGKIDNLIFKSPMKWMAWYCMIELRRAD